STNTCRTLSLHDALPIFRMFPDVGMVRRTIDGEIERDLHPTALDFVLEPGKILEAAERRFDRLVPAPFAPNRVRHAGFAGLAGRSEEHTSELQSLRHLVC